MNKLKQFLLRNRIWFLWVASAIFIIISFLIIYFKIKPQESPDVPVALHYNVLVGVDLYGRSRNLFLIPLTGLIIFTFFLFNSVKLFTTRQAATRLAT